MAEYEMTAFRSDKEEPVQTMWFGQRPSDEWVHKLAKNAKLGQFVEKQWSPEITLKHEHGYIEVRKHTHNTNLPPAKKRNI